MSTDIYSMPDLTKKVRHRDGERRRRGDTEDRGEREERVVDIYESIDDFGAVPAPLQVMTGGGQTQRQQTTPVRRSHKVVIMSLGLLCLMLLGVVIGLAVHYNQLQNRYNKIDHLLSTNFNADKCPCGWRKFGDNFYYRSRERKNWEKSRQECQSIVGADLVVINSKEEQEFIKGWDNRPSWIGLNRSGENWTWVDGSPLTTDWNWGRSDYGHCAKCYNRTWERVSCDWTNIWICETLLS